MPEFFPPAQLDEIYQSWAVRILDEVDTAYLVVDFDPQNRKLHWCNNAAASLFGRRKEAMAGQNLSTSSVSISQHQDEIFRVVQQDGSCIDTWNALFEQLEPSEMSVKCKPISVGSNCKTLALISVVPDSPSAKENCWKTMSNVVVQHVDVISTLFDMESRDSIFQNAKAEAYYVDFVLHSVAGRTPTLTLANVLDSCVWSSADLSQEELLAKLSKIEVGMSPIELTCKKQRVMEGSQSNTVWHRLAFRAVICPLTSRSCLLLNEYDVTCERLFRSDLDHAKKAEQGLKDFVSAVSHELRTPLHGIIGLSDCVLVNPTDIETVRSKAAIIKECGEVLAGHLSNIEHSINRSGTLQLSLEDVALFDAVEAARQSYVKVVGGEVQLQNDVGSRFRAVCDGKRVVQVLRNLLSNAVKFTQRGSIAVSASYIGEDVLVEVADTGCGIPSAKLTEVWEPFRQLDMSVTRKTGGTGLGLWLVKDIVEAHGGSVGVRSNYGGSLSGSTFWFTLPQKRKDVTPLEPKPVRRCLEATYVVSLDKEEDLGSWSLTPSAPKAEDVLSLSQRDAAPPKSARDLADAEASATPAPALHVATDEPELHAAGRLAGGGQEEGAHGQAHRGEEGGQASARRRGEEEAAAARASQWHQQRARRASGPATVMAADHQRPTHHGDGDGDGDGDGELTAEAPRRVSLQSESHSALKRSKSIGAEDFVYRRKPEQEEKQQGSFKDLTQCTDLIRRSPSHSKTPSPLGSPVAAVGAPAGRRVGSGPRTWPAPADATSTAAASGARDRAGALALAAARQVGAGAGRGSRVACRALPSKLGARAGPRPIKVTRTLSAAPQYQMPVRSPATAAGHPGAPPLLKAFSCPEGLAEGGWPPALSPPGSAHEPAARPPLDTAPPFPPQSRSFPNTPTVQKAAGSWAAGADNLKAGRWAGGGATPAPVPSIAIAGYSGQEGVQAGRTSSGEALAVEVGELGEAECMEDVKRMIEVSRRLRGFTQVCLQSSRPVW